MSSKGSIKEIKTKETKSAKKLNTRSSSSLLPNQNINKISSSLPNIHNNNENNVDIPRSKSMMQLNYEKQNKKQNSHKDFHTASFKSQERGDLFP